MNRKRLEKSKKLDSIRSLEKKPKYKALLLVVLTGLLITLAFPKWDQGYLAWIGLIPLFIAIRETSLRSTFLLSVGSSFIFYYLSLVWITETMINYGGVNIPLSYFILALLALYLALYLAAGITAARHLDKRGIPLFISVPVFWIAQDYLRGTLLTGFPWNFLGYTQYKYPLLIQIADSCGPYGVTFIIVFFNIAVVESLFRSCIGFKRWIPLVSALCLVIITALYGAYSLSDSTSVQQSVTIGYIQGNIPQDEKWEMEYRDRIIDRYVSMTQQLLEKHQDKNRPDIIVWPEAATPHYFRFGDQHLLPSGQTYNEAIYGAIRNTQTWLLLGTPDIDPKSDWHYNAAFLLNPKGMIESLYYKQHLVPFGEYVPLRKILFFVEKMAQLGGDFGEGAQSTVFRVPELPAFSTYICYETVFPDLVRRFVKDGALLLFNLTNDAWFGASSGPYQHFSVTVFRAVENHVPIFRCANTGISGYIDPWGRIKYKSQLLTTQSDVLSVAVPEIKEHKTSFPTLYTRHGDIFALCCVAGSVILGVYGLLKKRVTGT